MFSITEWSWSFQLGRPFMCLKERNICRCLLCTSLTAPVNSLSNDRVTELSSEMLNSEGALENICFTPFVLHRRKPRPKRSQYVFGVPLQFHGRAELVRRTLYLTFPVSLFTKQKSHPGAHSEWRKKPGVQAEGQGGCWTSPPPRLRIHHSLLSACSSAVLRL